MDKLSAVLGQLPTLAMSLIILGVVLCVVFGGDAPFVGDVLGNLLGIVNTLGDAGLVGLLVAGYLMAAMD